MDAEMRAAMRRVAATGKPVPRITGAIQSAYVGVTRVAGPKPRRNGYVEGTPEWIAREREITRQARRGLNRAAKRGTQMATSGEKDGLEVEILIRQRDGSFYKPFALVVRQTEDEIQLMLGEDVIYTVRKI